MTLEQTIRPDRPSARADYHMSADLFLPANEEERLSALEGYDIIDTPREEEFDRIVRMVRRLFKAPISLVSFVDDSRQWYKAYEGLDQDHVRREDSFCKWTVTSGQPLTVADARSDDRFRDSPFVVGEPHIRFYVGVPLRSKDGFSIGTLCVADTEPREPTAADVELLSAFAEMAMQELELRNLATRDALTGVRSRRAFKEDGSRAVAFALRYRQALSCTSLDIDHFKAVNDTYGHSAGDAVLQQVIAACTGTLRQTDIVGRLGGEEFAVLLPHTDAAGALEASERMRQAIEARDIDIGGRMIRVTASFGVATIGADARDIDSLLRNADRALYIAKDAGRNRTAVWTVTGAPAE